MGVVAMPRRESPPVAERTGRPAKSGRKPIWPGVLDRVAAEGGEWMRVGEYKNANGAYRVVCFLRKRHNAADRFDFSARKVDGAGVVYARLRTEPKS